MYIVITELELTEAVGWSFELQLVIDDFISITIKLKLWISFELQLKLNLTIPNLFSYSYY